jgi:hypothetical protein
VTSLSVAASALNSAGAQAEVKAMCPTTCSLKVADVPPSKIATELQGNVQNDLQRDSKYNYIFALDFYASYVIAAENALGTKIPIVGQNGLALPVAQKDSLIDADLVYAPFDYIGWESMDTLIRAVNGQKNSITSPYRLLDSTNWGTTTDTASLHPDLANYQDRFKKLWDVG